MAHRERQKRSGARVSLLSALLALVMLSSLIAGYGGGSGTDGASRERDGREPGQTALTWPFPYRDPFHTGRSAAEGPSTADVKWAIEAGSES